MRILTTFLAVLLLDRDLFLRTLRPLLDQLLAVFLPQRDPSLVAQILVHEIVGFVVVVRRARRLYILHRWRRSVFVRGRAHHQHQYRAADGSEITIDAPCAVSRGTV